MHLSKTQLYACCLIFSTSSFHRLSVLIASTFTCFCYFFCIVQKIHVPNIFCFHFAPSFQTSNATLCLHVIKLWCACAAKVTVVGSVCVHVYTFVNVSLDTERVGMPQTHHPQFSTLLLGVLVCVYCYLLTN